MEIITLAIVVLLSVGISIGGGLGVLLYFGRRNRQKFEKAIQSTAPLPAEPEPPKAPAQPPFDPTGLFDAIRIVTESCHAQAAILQKHEQHLNHHQQALVIHDNALVQFQHDQAINAHAIAMLQEGVKDLTAITSKDLPSGKMYPSVNEFLAKSREVPIPEVPEKIIIEDNPDDPHQEPDVPAKMPPPFPESKIKPKGRKRG